MFSLLIDKVTELKVALVVFLMLVSSIYLSSDFLFYLLSCVLWILSCAYTYFGAARIIFGIYRYIKGSVEDNSETMRGGLAIMGNVASWSIISGIIAVYGSYSNKIDGNQANTLFLFQFVFGSIYSILYFGYCVVNIYHAEKKKKGSNA